MSGLTPPPSRRAFYQPTPTRNNVNPSSSSSVAIGGRSSPKQAVMGKGGSRECGLEEDGGNGSDVGSINDSEGSIFDLTSVSSEGGEPGDFGGGLSVVSPGGWSSPSGQTDDYRDASTRHPGLRARSHHSLGAPKTLPNDSVIRKYIQRFRHAPPMSRETRARIRASRLEAVGPTTLVTDSDFWWRTGASPEDNGAGPADLGAVPRSSGIRQRESPPLRGLAGLPVHPSSPFPRGSGGGVGGATDGADASPASLALTDESLAAEPPDRGAKTVLPYPSPIPPPPCTNPREGIKIHVCR